MIDIASRVLLAGCFTIVPLVLMGGQAYLAWFQRDLFKRWMSGLYTSWPVPSKWREWRLQQLESENWMRLSRWTTLFDLLLALAWTGLIVWSLFFS